MSQAETVETEQATPYWQGVLAIEGRETSDHRYLIPGQISERDLPLPLLAQFANEEGHQGAKVGAGKITEVWREPQDDGSVLILGRGPFDTSEVGQEAMRLVQEEMMRGVSVDLGDIEAIPLMPETYEPIDVESMSLEDLMALDPVQGMGAKIMGATLVAFPAFEDATLQVLAIGDGAVAITASAGMTVKTKAELIDIPFKFWRGLPDDGSLVAAAAKLPPREWLNDPNLAKPTPLTYTDDGHIYGHLALWDSCHTGYQGICVAPPPSPSDYAYFNTGLIETADGTTIPCGKLMFSRKGVKHASLDLAAAEAARHYDNATNVGGYVRAGADPFGIWLNGFLNPELDGSDLAHLKAHPPSGDWRSINGSRELVAAFSVPIPGFPVPHAEARLVASAEGDEIAALILSPAEMPEPIGGRERQRRMKALSLRVNKR